MSALARVCARQLWFITLWIMRRRWISSIQRWAINRAPAERRAKAIEGLKKQNRFARRIGLPLMTFVMNLCLASIFLNIIYHAALSFVESGALDVPDAIRERAALQGQ